MEILPAWMCVDYILACRETGREHRIPMELELQMLVSHCADAGNRIWALCKSIKCA